MSMWNRVARLFTVKTRFEAFLIIYAIAVGAAERAKVYLETYPGWAGILLASLCSGVVFVAGAKLLDAVRRDQELAAASPARATLPRPRRINRSRRTSRPRPTAARSRSSLRTD